MSDRRSEHRPDVPKEGIVAAGVSSHAVDIRCRSVEFGPMSVLQADAEIQPWPEPRAAVTEWQIGEFEDPAGAVRAATKGAVKRRVSGAANRHPTRGQAPGLVIDLRSRCIQRTQLVIGIVGEPERLAGAGIVIFVYPGGAHGNRMRITQILVLGIDADIGERIIARGRHPHWHDF